MSWLDTINKNNASFTKMYTSRITKKLYLLFEFYKKIMANYFVSGLKNRTICVNNAVGTINDGSKI